MISGQSKHDLISPQGSAAGKKYKFVVTGHGKYEKIPADGEDGREFTNGESGKTQTGKSSKSYIFIQRHRAVDKSNSL